MTTATKAAGSAATSRVRADYFDPVVCGTHHRPGRCSDSALIRAEITKRLEQARTADPATWQRKQLQLALAKAATGITAMIEPYAEQVITIDTHCAPGGRRLDALDAQLTDRRPAFQVVGKRLMWRWSLEWTWAKGRQSSSVDVTRP
jgi:hypothetical protein